MNETAEMLLNMAHKINKDLKKGKKACYQNPELKIETSTIENPHESVIADVDDSAPLPKAIENYCSVVKKVKKENITKENIGEIILSQIPGISSVSAIAIMKNFESFPHFLEIIQKNHDVLNNISYETNGAKRKISKKIIESIKLYFTKTPIL